VARRAVVADPDPRRPRVALELVARLHRIRPGRVMKGAPLARLDDPPEQGVERPRSGRDDGDGVTAGAVDTDRIVVINGWVAIVALGDVPPPVVVVEVEEAHVGGRRVWQARQRERDPCDVDVLELLVGVDLEAALGRPGGHRGQVQAGAIEGYAGAV